MDPPVPGVSPHGHPSELGATRVSEFLSWLATRGHVSASTQNQALSAILFLYRSVTVDRARGVDGIVRATTPRRLPVVLSRAEVAAILGRLDGATWLVVTTVPVSSARVGATTDSGGGDSGAPESASGRAITRSGIHLPRICSKMGMTFELCRSYWGMRMSVRR